MKISESEINRESEEHRNDARGKNTSLNLPHNPVSTQINNGPTDVRICLEIQSKSEPGFGRRDEALSQMYQCAEHATLLMLYILDDS